MHFVVAVISMNIHGSCNHGLKMLIIVKSIDFLYSSTTGKSITES